MLLLSGMVVMLMGMAFVPASEPDTLEDEDSFGPDEPDEPGTGHPVDPVFPPQPEPQPEPRPEPLPSVQDGTGDADWLYGSIGEDVLSGHGGDDDIRGAQGDDRIGGGAGSDTLLGDDDYGPGGRDTIDGGDDDDFIGGQNNDDALFGAGGNDTMFGGDGNDHVHGGAGDDWVGGNAGNDTLVGGAGRDDLDGGLGDDLLLAADDDEPDFLHGGDGDDTLVAGNGDYAEGGAGHDLYRLGLNHPDVPTLGQFDPAEDRIEVVLPAGYGHPGDLTLEPDDDGSVLLRLDGTAIARVLQTDVASLQDLSLTTVRAA